MLRLHLGLQHRCGACVPVGLHSVNNLGIPKAGQQFRTMFYSTQLLGKKGPLGIIWIAAHRSDKQLNRRQIFETSVPGSVGKLCSSVVSSTVVSQQYYILARCLQLC